MKKEGKTIQEKNYGVFFKKKKAFSEIPVFK